MFLPFDDLNFDLTIATVSSGDEAVLPQFLPTMLLLSPLFCLAVLQLNSAVAETPPPVYSLLDSHPTPVLFFRQRKEQEVCTKKISDAQHDALLQSFGLATTQCSVAKKSAGGV